MHVIIVSQVMQPNVMQFKRSNLASLITGSIGTTRCASAVGKYRHFSGKEMDVFYRGCIDRSGE